MGELPAFCMISRSITCMKRRCEISRVARWNCALVFSTSASSRNWRTVISQAERYHQIVGKIVSSGMRQRHRSVDIRCFQMSAWEAVNIIKGASVRRRKAVKMGW